MGAAVEIDRMEFDETDEGKTVINADDEKIGVVVDVRDGTAYVEPEPSLAAEVKAKLGWGDAEPDEDAFALREGWVDVVDDDEILLRTRPET
ncbi:MULTISPECIES: hypothetical protein [Halorussus]|uniref:hypothetical protein n=1 Tax=Halorussus TaxID=1070314 RepID=UPI0020A0D112|nr:hypothetical protein [Halorussus vallis]USZ75062.1 hypothetical protein NGM07_16700 [Halorussus vallis]